MEIGTTMATLNGYSSGLTINCHERSSFERRIGLRGLVAWSVIVCLQVAASRGESGCEARHRLNWVG